MIRKLPCCTYELVFTPKQLHFKILFSLQNGVSSFQFSNNFLPNLVPLYLRSFLLLPHKTQNSVLTKILCFYLLQPAVILNIMYFYWIFVFNPIDKCLIKQYIVFKYFLEPYILSKLCTRHYFLFAYPSISIKTFFRFNDNNKKHK